jgi:hypothetical protein
MLSQQKKIIRFKVGDVPRNYPIRKLIGKKCSECPNSFYTLNPIVKTCGPECGKLRRRRLRRRSAENNECRNQIIITEVKN